MREDKIEKMILSVIIKNKDKIEEGTHKIEYRVEDHYIEVYIRGVARYFIILNKQPLIEEVIENIEDFLDYEYIVDYINEDEAWSLAEELVEDLMSEYSDEEILEDLLYFGYINKQEYGEILKKIEEGEIDISTLSEYEAYIDDKIDSTYNEIITNVTEYHKRHPSHELIDVDRFLEDVKDEDSILLSLYFFGTYDITEDGVEYVYRWWPW